MSKTKRFIRTAALTAALLGVMGAGMAYAAPPLGGPGEQEHEGGRHEWGWHHHHEHGDLDLHGVKLTDKQQDQLFKLKHDAEPAFHEKFKALRQTHENLQKAAGFANYNPAQVHKLAEVQGQQMADLTMLKIELKHKAFALLTPEQQKQVLEHEQHREQHEHRGE